MKILCTLVLVIASVAASANESSTSNTQSSTASALSFGVYRMLPEYRAVASTSSKKTAANRVGELNVVATKNPASYLKPNSVLRNTMTGKLAIVSGRITVLTNNPPELTRAANDLGLKSLTSVDNNRVQFLQAKSGSNMLELKKKLEALEGVVEVRLDIIEDKLKPQ